MREFITNFDPQKAEKVDKKFDTFLGKAVCKVGIPGLAAGLAADNLLKGKIPNVVAGVSLLVSSLVIGELYSLYGNTPSSIEPDMYPRVNPSLIDLIRPNTI